MTINELNIQFDLQPKNKTDILKDVARKCNKGYLFVDSSDGHCYLFDKNENEDDIKKIKSIEDYAFAWCRSLKSIIIPDSVESIGYNAFAVCQNLKSIEIPDSVQSIGKYAFYGCQNLTSIIILDSVESIGECAFEWCQNLTSINISDSIKSIGDYAFANCKNLKSLTFKNKTIDEVRQMSWYPWEIKDESIIKCI